MKVLVLLLLLLGVHQCAEGTGLCASELCKYSRGILKESSYDCGILNVCQAHNNIVETFSECACTCTNVPSLIPLIGILLVSLVLVVIGWVWTCWTLKKKNKEIQHCKNCQKQESDSEDERFGPNQIYKMTTTQPVVGTAIEQPLDSLEESGQSTNGLRGKNNKGHCVVRRVENLYTSSEGSSHSSLQEEQRVNRVEEGECGEKHVYHVLEKPRDEDYEEVDKTLEDNTAMEYETPVPSNELGLKLASIYIT